MTWEQIFDAHRAANFGGGPARNEELLENARHQLSSATQDDWKKLEDALSDKDLKWLLAGVFRRVTFKPGTENAGAGGGSGDRK